MTNTSRKNRCAGAHRLLMVGMVAAAFCLVPSVRAASGQSKVTLAVGIVATNRALVEDMERQGKTIEMGRVVESLDHHLVAALEQIDKFAIVARSDLKPLLDEKDLGRSGIVLASTAPETGKVKGAKYKLLTTVDSFLEGNEAAEHNGRKAIRRRFQLSAQAIIYDTTTSEALEASNFQVEKQDVVFPTENEVSDAKRTDELMPVLAREMAEKVARRSLEVIFPAKIIDKEDKLITINRGDATGIHVGEIWNVFGPAKTITDPDSGQVTKRKGALLGRLKITSVEPTYSQGELLEDKGVVTGCVVTKPQEVAIPNGAGK